MSEAVYEQAGFEWLDEECKAQRIIARVAGQQLVPIGRHHECTGADNRS